MSNDQVLNEVLTVTEDETQATGQRLNLESGRSIHVRPASDESDRVTIRGGQGEIELEVTLTDRGPILHFRAAEMEITSDGKVQVDCDEFRVRANSRIVQQTRGSLHQHAAGDAVLSAQGNLTVQAHSTEIRTTRGDVQINANDDVRLNGERVKLNC